MREKQYSVFTQSGKNCSGLGHLTIPEACCRVIEALTNGEDVVKIHREPSEGDWAQDSSVQPVGNINRQTVSRPVVDRTDKQAVIPVNVSLQVIADLLIREIRFDSPTGLANFSPDSISLNCRD